MRKWWIALLSLPLVILLYACGGGRLPNKDPDDLDITGDVCPLVDAGTPPVCPEGCAWDGAVCRRHSGIIMPGNADGGPPENDKDAGVGIIMPGNDNDGGTR